MVEYSGNFQDLDFNQTDDLSLRTLHPVFVFFFEHLALWRCSQRRSFSQPVVCPCVFLVKTLCHSMVFPPVSSDRKSIKMYAPSSWMTCIGYNNQNSVCVLKDLIALQARGRNPLELEPAVINLLSKAAIISGQFNPFVTASEFNTCIGS